MSEAGLKGWKVKRIKGNRGQTHYDNEEGKEKMKSGQNLNKKSIQKGRGEKKNDDEQTYHKLESYSDPNDTVR